MNKIVYFCYGLLMLVSCQPEEYTLQSPGKKVSVRITFSNEKPEYAVFYMGKPVIRSSSLGLELMPEGRLGKKVKVISSSDSVIKESYPMYSGKTSTAVNHCHQKSFILEEISSHRTFTIIFRAYDEGIAFRYVVPLQKNTTSYLKQERSQFCFLPGTVCWFQHLDGFATGYEKQYLPDSFPNLSKQSIIGLPLTFELPNGVSGCVVEADLVNYAGMYLQKDTTTPYALVSLIAPRKDNPAVCVKCRDTLITPWRAIMLAERPVDLIASSLVTHLNPPCAIKDPSWIKPGLCAWDWWCYQLVPPGAPFKRGMNTETMKYYIDFAAEYHLPYMLIDAGWYGDYNDTALSLTQTIPEFDIHELVRYGQSKQVDLILWVNWYNLNRQMDTTLKTFSQWGVKGFKVDFMATDDQEMVDFYNTTARKAAQYHLMVDFHGAYKPTGMERTWPNVMTREGVMGLEHSKAGTGPTPTHNVTLPFTRMLCGPMDYTPGGFFNVDRRHYIVYHEPPTVFGTRCHQLAMYVVYESGWQMVSDWPEAYRQARESEFLKVVPASWDKTTPIDGEIGKYIILARKSAGRWFLGAMCGWRDNIGDQPIPASCLINEKGEPGGLTARYFSDMHFNHEVKTQTDTTLRFNWQSAGPAGLPHDFFSIRWTGKIKPPVPGKYELIGRSDDGMKIWLNNKLIINEWRKQAPFDRYATVFLEAGKEYPVRIDYFEQDGGAQFNLSWILPHQEEKTGWKYFSKTIPLDFLDEGVTYEATIYHDNEKTADNPQSVAIESRKMKKGDSLSVEMAEGGGMAVYFKPLNK